MIQLAGDGYVDVIGQAATGMQALELIRKLRPDLALLDVRLPDMDGLKVVAAARDEGIPTRIVIFSAYEAHGLADRAFTNGAWGYVTKGAPATMVVQALRAAHSGQRFLDPQIAHHFTNPRTQPLSERERQILQLMAQGKQNGPIATELGIAAETVKTHVSHIFDKLRASSRTEAVARGLRDGLID